MPRKEYVIGLDGGGTKTAGQLADLKGNVIAEEVGGPSNFQILGVESAAEALLDVIERCCERAHCKPQDIAVVVAGLTGAGRATDQDRMREGLRERAARRKIAFDRVVIDSDARIALEGAFKGRAGIILISGTGSIAFGKGYDGRVFRAGGWGRILGDEGSGYALGRDGLNAITRALDGRGKKTKLAELVAREFGLSTQEQIITAVYREHFDIASVAPLVIEAAAQHDLECERILNKATFELTEHVRALTVAIEAASPHKARQKIPLAFIGSVISGENVLSKILRHKIEFSLPQITIVKPEAPPAYGAVLMAIASLRNSA